MFNICQVSRKPLIQLALSSFWMSGRYWRLRDFFAAGVNLGFDTFELSGFRDSTFYDEIHPGDFRIVSLHDPAPPARGNVGVGSKELRRADILYTSLDEERRRQAVAITKRTVDIAADFGARAIVLHVGQTSIKSDIEKKLKKLFREGKIACPEANELRSRLTIERTLQHSEIMNALHHSLDELVACAAARSIQLGIENRPAHEIAGFSEIGEMLSWYQGETNVIGYWHDTGHAQVQANLGLTPHADWLRAYANRLIGIHLHDAVGVENHSAPGEGNVDWFGLTPLVPVNGIRVVEVDRTVSEEALRAGVGFLRETGWFSGLTEQVRVTG